MDCSCLFRRVRIVAFCAAIAVFLPTGDNLNDKVNYANCSASARYMLDRSMFRRPGLDKNRHLHSALCHEESGSYSVIDLAASSVFGPRSF